MTLIEIMNQLDRIAWDVIAYHDERVKSERPALKSLVKARAYLDLAKISLLDALTDETKEQNE